MFYERKLTEEIMKYIKAPEAIVILGSRQVGKTTLLKIIMNEIGVSKRGFYLDLEETKNLDIVNKGPENLMEYLYSLGAAKNAKNYVFLDEFHYMENPSKFLKLAVDHYSDKMKIVCTGSSALRLRMKFEDALVGRKLTFNLYPLDFHELLVFKKRKNLSQNLPLQPLKEKKDSTQFFRDDYIRYFNEFLVFGGYPRVVLEDSFEKKEKILGEIVSTYIYKDIKSLFNIGSITRFNNLIRVLASQAGTLVNVSELARLIGISRPTVLRYFSILENLFVISLLSPYSRNVRVEVRKANKIFWHDNGIRNYIIGDMTSSLSRTDIGVLLENMVFTGFLKRKKEIDKLYFWRTKDKTEVDFVYEKAKKIIPIEVKTHARQHRGLKNFMKKYKVRNGYIAHLGDFRRDTISFIPAFWLS